MSVRLVIKHSDGRSQEVELAPDRDWTLGRSRKSAITLTDGRVSAHHARIFHRDGRWYVCDCNSRNHTYVDGERIDDETALEHGQTIAVGGDRMTFLLDDVGAGSAVTPQTIQTAASDSSGHPFEHLTDDSDNLPADEAMAMLRFMKQSLEESSHLQVIRCGLEALQTQVGASTVGFLSFDPAAPVPKLVLPQRSGLNQNLSQELTRRVKRDGRTVWMGEPQDTEASSESLASFSDAFCVPLGTQEAPQGALHVYARGSHFKKKDLRFAEALADCLNQSLKQLNRQRGLRAENQRLRAGLPPEDAFLGSCPGMVTLRDHLARFAASKARAILIVGESGTGKELVARQLHRTSARADKPFVTVNCAALPRDLVDSHLFGHAKGAFSGATEKHAGFFAEADDGTLFLDEIADLPEGCQAKLLRVIEGYSFRPVGGSEDVEVDVRVVAATNQNIEELVKHGKFRGDLRQRFEVVLSLPPLRERGDDVEELARYFLNKIALEQSREPKFALTEAAVNRLKSFPWPGNIRQLRSAISKAIILCDGDTIDAADFDLVATPESDESRPQSLKLADVKAWAIRRALRQVSGGLARVAAALGINRDTLRKLMIEYGIEKQ